MMVTIRRTAIIAGGGTDGTIAPGVQALQMTGPGGHNLIADQPPTTGHLSLQPHVAPKPVARRRSGATGPVFSAGKSQPFGRRPSQLRCRSIFSRKNGPFPKLFSRSS